MLTPTASKSPSAAASGRCRQAINARAKDVVNEADAILRHGNNPNAPWPREVTEAPPRDLHARLAPYGAPPPGRETLCAPELRGRHYVLDEWRRRGNGDSDESSESEDRDTGKGETETESEGEQQRLATFLVSSGKGASPVRRALAQEKQGFI